MQEDRCAPIILNKDVKFGNEMPIPKGLSRLQGRDFPGGAVVKNLPANAGDTGSTLVREDPSCHGATKPVHSY